MQFFSEKFKEQRVKNRFSSVAFCAAANISRSSLWNWENGIQVPSEAVVRHLASILNIAVSEISDLASNISDSKDEFRINAANVIGLGIPGLKELQINSKRIVGEIGAQTDLIGKIIMVFSAFMSSAEFMLYIKDADNKYIVANNAFTKMLGLDPDYKVLGKKDEDFFPEEEALENSREDMSVISTCSQVSRECAIIGSRKKKWGMASKYPIIDEKGKCMGLIGIINDITYRKKAEERRRLLEYAMNKTEDIVFTIGKFNENNKFKYLFVSNGVEKIFKMSAKEFVSTDFKELLTPEYKHLADAKFDKYPVEGEYTVKLADGEIKQIHEITYNDGEIYISLIKDVTNRNEIEAVRKMIDVLFTEELGYVYAIHEKTRDGVKTVYFAGSEENLISLTGYSYYDYTNDPNLGFKILQPNDTKGLIKKMFDDKERKKLKFKIKKKNGAPGCIECSIRKYNSGPKIYYLVLYMPGVNE